VGEEGGAEEDERTVRTDHLWQHREIGLIRVLQIMGLGAMDFFI
jgi:hypothetical protein